VKNINGWWVDENNNKWNANYTTEEQAEKLRKSLINCRNCSDCSNCHGFKYNPERYVSYKLGSRNDNTTFYFYENNITVICGCFKGDLSEFKAKVQESRTENKHGIAYKKLIEKVERIFEVN
jgi:hypothetical protein